MRPWFVVDVIMEEVLLEVFGILSCRKMTLYVTRDPQKNLVKNLNADDLKGQNLVTSLWLLLLVLL